MAPADPVALTVAEIAAGVNAGRLDPLAVAQAFLARAQARNPGLNALVGFDPAPALAAAEDVRRRLALGHHMPLAGVPVVVKDGFWVAGRRITQGSPLFRDFVSPRDALPVARLLQAGAVIVGIGNMPEFGCKDVTDNCLFGSTRHPMDPCLTTGGSSGGCAVAVAADMAPLALGGDGGGPSRRPPSHVGVVGFKPTNGAVADPWGFPGIMPGIAATCPIGRTVADVALMFEAIVCPHSEDPLSLLLPELLPRPVSALRAAFSPRLGLDVAVDADVADCVAAAVEQLRGAGLAVARADPPWPAGTSEKVILPIEYSGLAAQFGATWRHDPGQFDPHVGAQIEAGLALTGAEVAQAWNASLALASSLAPFLGEHDLLLCPTTACVSWDLTRINPERIGGVPSPPRGHAVFTPLFNHARTPAITIPCGAGRDGLPVGLQIIGPRLADRQVLAAAAWMERVLGPAARPWPRH